MTRVSRRKKGGQWVWSLQHSGGHWPRTSGNVSVSVCLSLPNAVCTPCPSTLNPCLDKPYFLPGLEPINTISVNTAVQCSVKCAVYQSRYLSLNHETTFVFDVLLLYKSDHLLVTTKRCATPHPRTQPLAAMALNRLRALQPCQLCGLSSADCWMLSAALQFTQIERSNSFCLGTFASNVAVCWPEAQHKKAPAVELAWSGQCLA